MKSELAQKMEAFRHSLNKQDNFHSDWYYIEDSVEQEGVLFAAMSREYCAGSKETAYSVVYVLTSAQQSPQQLYYRKFWDSWGSERNASVFIKKLQITKSGEVYLINAEAEDRSKINLRFPG
jgi:hypothetical protein